MGVEQSEGCGSIVSANQGDIREAEPSTPKHVAGSIAKGLAMLPRVATTPKSKEKGKGKAREEEEEEQFGELVEDSFTNKHLCDNCWAENDPEGCWYPTGAQLSYCCDSTSGSLGLAGVGVHGVAVGVGKEGQAYLGQAFQLAPANIAGWVNSWRHKEGEKETEDVEMREKTPLATIAEVEPAFSRGEVGKKEMEVEAINKNEEGKDEERIRQREAWSSTLLQQVGYDELEWLGEDLAWLTLLMLAILLLGYNKRVAGVEWQF
ncbi:hypothetical protein C0989_010000 [Termitomyces sp. Mn162]|nr:hypothetical protein C0989_010000 [Termitomyces sp. Mn162]